MTLKEMNESYDAYTQTDEYLEEGLKFFKQSKAIRKFSKTLDLKIKGLKNKNNPPSTKYLEDISKDLKNLADKFEDIEEDFKDKQITKREAKSKIATLRLNSERLLKKMKSQKMEHDMKKLGMMYVSMRIAKLVNKMLEYKWPEIFNPGYTGSSVMPWMY